MQNTPTSLQQPPTHFRQDPPNTPPSEPPHKPAKKRFKYLGLLAGVVSGVLAALAALTAIFQFLGIPNLDVMNLFSPPSAPLPVISESVIKEASPACESTHRRDIRWLAANVQYTCLPNNAGTKLVQTDGLMIPALSILTSGTYRFAPNYILGETITGLANNVCAGLGARENLQDHAAYGFFVCGDGNWYIAKYSKDTGAPMVLAKSTSTTKVQAADHYDLEVIVLGSGFQMVINNNVQGVYTANDASFSLTTKVSILFGEEGALTSYAAANLLTTITVSNFYYETNKPAPNTLASLIGPHTKIMCMCNVSEFWSSFPRVAGNPASMRKKPRGL